MVNKPKADGTAAESAVVGWLQEHGHPGAERRSLHGSIDKGDVTGCPGLCIEVKKVGRLPQLAGWLRETRTETINSKADWGFLVMKPPGLGSTRVGQWWAAMYNGDWEKLLLVDLGIVPAERTLFEITGNKILSLGEVMRLHTPAMETAPVGSSILIKAKKEKGQKGMAPNPANWYRVTTLEQMNWLIRQAGYGTPPEG